MPITIEFLNKLAEEIQQKIEQQTKEDVVVETKLLTGAFGGPTNGWMLTFYPAGPSTPTPPGSGTSFVCPKCKGVITVS